MNYILIWKPKFNIFHFRLPPQTNGNEPCPQNFNHDILREIRNVIVFLLWIFGSRSVSFPDETGFPQAMEIMENLENHQTNFRPKVSKMCPHWRTEDDINLRRKKIDFLRQYLSVSHHFLDAPFTGMSVFLLQLKIKNYSHYLSRNSCSKFDIDVPITQ